MTDKHSPTPWQIDECNVFRVIDPIHGFVCLTFHAPNSAEMDKANAALIVEAVNGHAAHKEAVADLLAALRMAVQRIDPTKNDANQLAYINGINTIAKHSPEKVRG
jgi:hypothetical protein